MGAQAPALHAVPAAQAWLPPTEHAPQFALSLVRSWHFPSPHRLVPATHETPQELPLHTLPAAHAWSVVPAVEHVPQFPLSFVRSWHLLSLHRLVPATHEMPQVLPLHTLPAAQA